MAAREARLHDEQLRIVSALLPGVAHDLNSPLAVLVGQATLLRRKAGDGPLADRADKIVKAAERCARIVRSFMAIAYREPTVRVLPVDIVPLLHDMLEILGYGLRVEGVEARVEAPESLGAIRGDAHRLRLLVVQLVLAVQRTLQPLTPPRVLTIRLEAAAPRVRLVVAGSGSAVPAGGGPETEGEGAVPGLELCGHIAEEHGGSLQVESSREGTRVVVELPMAFPAADGAGPGARPAAAPGRAILVVDDEIELGELVRDTLSERGHVVDTAVSAAEALERLALRRYDLALIDLHMPTMDGPALYRELQRSHPDLARRVVFLSGDALSAGTSAFLEESRASVLHKPFDLGELSHLVDRILTR